MNIFCIGRNYAEHAKELGNAIPDSPIVFLKPSGSYIEQPTLISLPWIVGAIHHEVEIVIRMGAKLEPKDWSIGIDLTARDVQNVAKEKGQPWTFAKGLKNFAPVGNWVKFEQDWKSTKWSLGLSVDGTEKQNGSSEMMLWNVPRLIKLVDESFGLKEGDLIFTGTPKGVGPLGHGSKVEALGESSGSCSNLKFQCQ
ncbi:MAG: fumarylacetoacetate hydrolase family protein [Xanthomonadaceae bacterium]|nr:fumarylacetoacetate hydrolase family protein [Xanthomonadaceae bacterium]